MDHQEALSRFMQHPAGDLAGRTAIYEHEVFPAYRRAFEEEAVIRDKVAFLLTAVGTQPYSPALAISAASPGWCSLLTTSETEALAPKVLELAGYPVERARTVPIGDGMDADLVIRIVRAEFLRSGAETDATIVDVTSGRKATAAALGTAATALGLRQSYIESDLIQPGNFGVNPKYRLIYPPSSLQRLRSVARLAALLEYGHVADAQEEARAMGEAGDAIQAPLMLLEASQRGVEVIRENARLLSDWDEWPAIPDSEQDLGPWRGEMVRAIMELVQEP